MNPPTLSDIADAIRQACIAGGSRKQARQRRGGNLFLLRAADEASAKAARLLSGEGTEL